MPRVSSSIQLISLLMFFIMMVQSTTASINNNNNNNTILSNQTQSISEQLLKLTGNTVAQAEDVMDEWIGKRQWNTTTSRQFNEQVLAPLRNLRIALIVVDFQNDFVGGSLKIADGDAGQDPNLAIAPLNDLLINSTWDLVVYTKDWHLPNHISFLSQAHSDDRELAEKDANRVLNMFDSVDFTHPIKTTQILYPDHCIQNSWGSEIHQDIVMVQNSEIIFKGVDPYLDSYSAFFDNNGHNKTELEDILHREKIDAVVIAGLAYDICVRYTCLDAVKQNFMAAVIPECSAGLLRKGISEAEEAFENKGVAIVTAEKAKGISDGSFLPNEWVKKVAQQQQNT